MINLGEYLLTRDVDDEHIQSYYNNDIYTTGEYRQVINELITRFEEEEFSRNTSALLLFDDCPLGIALFIACMKYGIVPILASTFTMNPVIDKSISAADLSFVFSDGNRDLSAFSSRVIIGDLTGQMRPGEAVLNVKSRPDDFKPPFVDSSEMAFFMLTSGSTGEPKVVIHSHEGMVFTLRVYAKDTLGIGPTDRIYSIARTSFGYGLANNLIFSFGLGAPAYLEDTPFDVGAFFANMEHMSPTIMFGIPTAYRMILNYVEEHPEKREKLKTIKRYISAGETLPGDIAKEWKALTGVYIMDNMGSSEASAILLNPGHPDKFGSAGIPVKESEVRLRGADGKDSRAGSLYFKSEGNATGYYKNPKENALNYKNGYFTTGDVFIIDDDGYYWYMGREDNMMKYHGFWVFPKDIEEKIASFKGVKQVVVTKATIKGLDILAAALITDSEFEGTDKLAAFLEGELEIYKRPKKYMLFDSFPLNERGKINLRLLKEMAEEQ